MKKEEGMWAYKREAFLFALMSLAAVVVVTIADRNKPGLTSLDEATALALAESSFVPRAGANDAELADARSRRSAALLQQLSDKSINMGASQATKAPTSQLAMESAADSAATKLVDEAFSRAMADAQGSPAKQVKPIMPVMPVFPANWEPKMPTVRKAEAAKRLQAKADQGDVLARLLDEAQQAAATAVKTNQLADKSLSDFSLKVPSVQQLAAAKKAPVQGATGGSAYEDSSEGANVQYRAASTSGLGFAGGGDPYKYIRTGHYADALKKEADVQQGWLDAASPKVVKMDNGDDGKEAKAKATVSALAAGPAKPVLASAPAKPADLRSEWTKALNRPDSLPMVDGVEQDVGQHPVASLWNKALNRPMNIQKGPAEVLAAKEPSVEHASVEQAEAPKKPQAGAPNEPAHQEKKAVVEQARPQLVHDAPVVLKKAVTGEGLLAKWMQALGLSPAPTVGIKSPATTPATTPNKGPQSHAQQQQTQLANRPKASAVTVFAAKGEPLSKAAPTVALHAKTQTRKDWMAALGFSDEPVKQVHVAHSKPVLATKELPPSISSTPANVVSSKQNLEANAFPAYDDDDVPAANTGAARAAPVHAAAAVGKLQHAAQTEDASRRGGLLAEWLAALHRKPAKVLAFSDGGDGRRPPGEALPNVRLSTAQTALAGKPLQEQQQQQQQLVAKGAWAKALGVSLGAGDASPAPKSKKSAAKPKIDKDSLWGDVLVRVGTPVMPGASRMPTVSGDSGVPLFDVFASDSGSKLSRMLSAPHKVLGKAGDKGKWQNALQRPSAFIAQGAKQELVGLDHPLASKAGERFSTALMRDAVKEGKSPRVVALETAMRRNSVPPFVDPFSDESVPLQEASFRTLWNN